MLLGPGLHRAATQSFFFIFRDWQTPRANGVKEERIQKFPKQLVSGFITDESCAKDPSTAKQIL